jgi:hypothetical protein
LEQVNKWYGKLESFKTYPCDLDKRKNLSIIYDVLNGLFDKMVKPILLYGCEVWGFEQRMCDYFIKTGTH